MNFTRIEWADYTINPQGHGCYGPGGNKADPRPCSYCYNRERARRKLSKCPLCNQWTPHWHPEALEIKLNQAETIRKHRIAKGWPEQHLDISPRVFVQSMGDLFHAETPRIQIHAVWETIMRHPEITWLLLTKNPYRYQEFTWPANCWLGTTITGSTEADKDRADAIYEIYQHLGKTWASIEPLIGPIDIPTPCNWIVIGAMTGRQKAKHRPELKWIDAVATHAKACGIPLYMKSSLKDIWPGELIQEVPE